MGETITKETIALGIGGQIERGDGFPELPKRSRVSFKAEADYENVKHRFLDGGGVEETLILTIDRHSFEVLDVTERIKDEPLPGMDDEPKRGRGKVAPQPDPTPADI
jgi:hypothetical protein